MKTIQANIKIIDGKISDIEFSKHYSSVTIDKKLYSFGNCFILPGFVDSHGHIAGLGEQMTGLNLSNCKSLEETISTISNSKPNRGDWIYGRGWNQENWDIKQMPDKEILDLNFPDVPVFLVRIDGHAAWVNSVAMKRAGIDLLNAEIQGGEICRNENGYPTGIMLDNAMEIIRKFIPDYTSSQISNFIKSALNDFPKHGLTEIHDMDVNPEYIDIFKSLEQNNEIPVRINSYIKAQNDEWKYFKIIQYKSEYLNICGLKFYIDGALGSRGAALIENYSDSNSKGLLFLSEFDLYEKVIEGLKNKWDITVHAIGDAGNRIVLNVFREIRKKYKEFEKQILRIEHAQIVHKFDLPEFSKYRIIASVQPIHCISDVEMAEKRLGLERCHYSYPWQSLLNSNATIIAGSDFPIESHKPITGIDAFVNRIPLNRSESWFPDERISIDNALDAYCKNPHIAVNNQFQRGELKIGYDADLVILDNDISNLPDNEIKNVKVVATVCNGKLYRT